MGINIEGKLQQIIHNYKQNHFRDSFISIKDDKDKQVKSGTFYGMVPETLLGKRVNLESIERKETSELLQYLRYKQDESEYVIVSYITNKAINQDFQ